MLALYRLVEPCAGRIVLDGIDVASIGLFDLRSRLALVPQVRRQTSPRVCSPGEGLPRPLQYPPGALAADAWGVPSHTLFLNLSTSHSPHRTR